MKKKKWKKMIITYFLTLIISWSLFLPIDVMLYGDHIANQSISNYLITNFFCISVTIIVFINIVRYFNSTFLRKRMILRFLLEVLCAIIISNIIVYMFQCIFVVKIGLYQYITLLKSTNFFFTNNLESIFTILFIETIYMHYQRKKTDLEKEKFKYDQLKNQLNPHFLFNSLNILLAMIYKRKPNECADFIEKLSDVYRYILNNEDKSLILVKEEVNFISKYGEILKTRFNNGFILNINLKEEDLKKKILLMSLQLLVENAVKHNIACEEIPLIIDIFSDNSSIIVSNTKNIRSNKTTSTGIGLNNLNQRYRIITNKDIKIIDEDNYFKVIIPLI